MDEAGRTISDADVRAIIEAIAEHEGRCRFRAINPDDLHDVMVTVRAFSAVMEESKSVIRKTLIVLLVSGIVSLVYLGSGVKIQQLFKP